MYSLRVRKLSALTPKKALWTRKWKRLLTFEEEYFPYCIGNFFILISIDIVYCSI